MAFPVLTVPQLDDHCHDKDITNDRKIPQLWHQNRQTYQTYKSKINQECKNRNCSIVAVQGNKLYFGRDVTSVLSAAGSCCFFMHMLGGPGFGIVPVETCTLDI